MFVWVTSITSILIVLMVLFWTFNIYRESQNNLFAINDLGEVIPLKKLDEKRDRIKQVKANMSYFVSCYYDLDGYTMKEKKEKVLWLVGKKPTAIIKDRDKKGYFNNFLSINGLVQHAKVKENTWKILSKENPYNVEFSIIIQLINEDNINYYNCDIKAVVEETSKNYPYNPYGLIITNYSEKLTKLDDNGLTELEKGIKETNKQN
jgi:hypothetical protein